MKFISMVSKICMTILLITSVHVFAKPGLAIIDLTNNKTSYPQKINDEHVLIEAHEALLVPARYYTTITKDKDGLVLNTFNTYDNKVEQHKLPLFQERYNLTTTYSISPDHKKVIHRNGYLKDLYLLDIDSGKDIMIWKDAVTEYDESIKTIIWLSEDKFLITLGFENGEGQNQITIFNIKDNTRKIIYRPFKLGESNIVISKDKKLLTFVDTEDMIVRPDGYQCIKILDLDTGTIVHTIGSDTYDIRELAWNESETELAYVEDGHNIVIWNKNANGTRTIVKSNGKFLVLKILFMADQIGYTSSYVNADIKTKLALNYKLTIIDANTSKKIRVLPDRFIGSMYYFKHSNSIIAEILK